MKFRRHHLYSVVAVALTIATATISCKPASNYLDDFVAIGNAGWEYGKSFDFVPEMADSIAEGTLSVAVCHDNRYPYTNLWLEVTVADSMNTRVDTLNVVLADAMGHWYGTGIGTDFQFSTPIDEKITLHRPAKLSVRHIMRDDNLRGVQRIGLIFKEN